ncbi:MAG: hypothetical protein IJW05_12325 [Lentisphaeria bacterium]|nr:hypothetical protein [Lentisphaeria bacterium]
MSENVLSCKSTDGEKVAVHGAWIDGTKKTVLVIGVGVAVVFGGLWYLNGKINQVKFESAVEIEKVKTSSEIKISNLEKQVEELKREYATMKEYAEDGRRAYEAARQTLSRSRKKSQ